MILGTTSQANVSQEYVSYTFEHFKNTITQALSSFVSYAQDNLNSLTSSDYVFYTNYINNVLQENNLSNLINKSPESKFQINKK